MADRSLRSDADHGSGSSSGSGSGSDSGSDSGRGSGSDADADPGSDLPSRRLLIAIAAAGVVVPGVLHYWLVGAGLAFVADAVWIGGYGLAVLAVWYGWLRPLDLAGPSG